MKIQREVHSHVLALHLFLGQRYVSLNARAFLKAKSASDLLMAQNKIGGLRSTDLLATIRASTPICGQVDFGFAKHYICVVFILWSPFMDSCSGDRSGQRCVGTARAR